MEISVHLRVIGNHEWNASLRTVVKGCCPQQHWLNSVNHIRLELSQNLANRWPRERHLHVGIERKRRPGDAVNASAFVFSNVSVRGDDEYLVAKQNKVANCLAQASDHAINLRQERLSKESYAKRTVASRKTLRIWNLVCCQVVSSVHSRCGLVPPCTHQDLVFSIIRVVAKLANSVLPSSSIRSYSPFMEKIKRSTGRTLLSESATTPLTTGGSQAGVPLPPSR